jgi:hypothetical protein
MLFCWPEIATVTPSRPVEPEVTCPAIRSPVVGVAAAAVSDSTFEAVCCGLLLSATVTVRLNVPATVGVPKTAPEEELIPMPPG